MTSVLRLHEGDLTRLQLLDRLESIERKLDVIAGQADIAQLEPWLSKRHLAAQLAVSPRWLDARTSEGMPSRMIAGALKFRLSEVELWLRRHGYLEETGER